MKTPEDSRRSSKVEDGSPDELLDDLESIKQLLDEESLAQEARARAKAHEQPGSGDARAAERPSASDDRAGSTGDSGVPLLDDMIDGAYKLEETSFLTVTPPLGRGAAARNSRFLSEDLFDALLGDEWKASASSIFTEARGAIEAQRNQWTPDDTDELNEALRIRIDETLSKWLRKTLRERMDELHAELLEAAEVAINEKVAAILKQRSGNP